MDKRKLWFCILILFMAGLLTEARALGLDFRVSGHFSDMKVDERGQIFLISGSTLHLVSNSGHMVGTRVFDGGAPTTMDVSRTNQIWLYNKGSSEMRITDRNLADRRKFSFEDAGIENPGVACLGENERVWVYDRDEQRFLELDHNMKVRRESESLDKFASHRANPTSVTWYDGHLLINNDNREVLIFNRFGTYTMRLDARNEGRLQVADGKVFFLEYGRARAANINSGRLEDLNIAYTFRNARTFLVKSNKLYVLNNRGLEVYNL